MAQIKIKKKPIKKIFALEWVFENLCDEPSFFTRKMFGCLAVYTNGKMVLLLAENETDPIWNGLLVPTERTHHKSLLGEFPALEPHAVLKKWLYLPLVSDGFEDTAALIQTRISKKDQRFGIIPKRKQI